MASVACFSSLCCYYTDRQRLLETRYLSSSLHTNISKVSLEQTGIILTFVEENLRAVEEVMWTHKARAKTAS